MSDITYLFIAFVAVWIGIGGYLATLGARQKRLERRLQDLDARPRSEGR